MTSVMAMASPSPGSGRVLPDQRVFDQSDIPIRNFDGDEIYEPMECPSTPAKSPPPRRSVHGHLSAVPLARPVQYSPRRSPVSRSDGSRLTAGMDSSMLFEGGPQSTPMPPQQELMPFSERFDVKAKVGEGDQAEVYMAQSRDNNQVYAVKRTKTAVTHSNRDTQKQRMYEGVLASFLSKKKHKNIVSVYAAWVDGGDGVDRLYVQTELLERGNLKDFLNAQRAPLSELTIWQFLIDILSGLQHLHSHNIVHRDVKPANIFLGNPPSPDSAPVLKIGDFGLAREIETKVETEGDGRYLARECLIAPHVVRPSIDVFAAGAIIYELADNVKGGMPNEGPVWDELREGRRPPRERSDELRRVIMLMMDPDPERRPSAEELLDDFQQTPHLQPILHERLSEQSTFGQRVLGWFRKGISIFSESEVFNPDDASFSSFLGSPSYMRGEENLALSARTGRLGREVCGMGLDDAPAYDSEDDVDVQPMNLSMQFVD